MRCALVSLFAAQKWKPSVDVLPCSPVVAAVRDGRARVREQLRSNSSAWMEQKGSSGHLQYVPTPKYQ
jgi:hypothetical protein